MKLRYLFLFCSVFFFVNPPQAAAGIYEVKKGDNLYKISKRFKIALEKIKETNSLDSTAVKPGMKLTIPARENPPKPFSSRERVSAPASRAPDPSEKQKDSREVSFHVVKRGETLSSIARRHSITINELRGMNDIQDARRLKPNRRLVLRQEAPKTYVVKNGDTFSKIAKIFALKAEDLINLNELEPEELKPGREILLRAEVDEADLKNAGEITSEAEIIEDLKDLSDLTGEIPSGIKQQLLLIARRMLDIPYLLGGNTYWGIDCSACVQKVFGYLNISLPRTAREQFKVGKSIRKENLTIGDLVFFRTYATFPSHVGIYLGQDQFIHASSYAKKVRIDRIDKPYFVKRFIGAKRLPLEHLDSVTGPQE